MQHQSVAHVVTLPRQVPVALEARHVGVFGRIAAQAAVPHPRPWAPTPPAPPRAL